MLNQTDRPTPRRVRRRDFPPAVTAVRSTSAAAAVRSTDVHRHVEQEFKKLEQQFETLRAQLRRAQSIASLGAAASVIAHEFRNGLTPLASYARYALQQDDKQLMARALEVAIKQSDALNAMSERVLGLVSNDAPDYRKANLRQIIQDAIECMCRDLSKDGIALNLDVAESLEVRGDPRQLQQVFFNLLINARQAMTNHNGRITISANRTTDDQVNVLVADSGPGIDAELLDRIFDGFFSTKRKNQRGTGLGLALCKNILEDHGGQISVSSEPGQGTTFSITLPAKSD